MKTKYRRGKNPAVAFGGAALLAHGVLDFFHAAVITDPGVPVWWPPFCLTFDVAAAAFLALRLRSHNPAGG